MDDKRVGAFSNRSTTVPEGYKGAKEGAIRGSPRSTSPKRRSSRVGKFLDKSSYCSGDKAFVNSVTLVGIQTCTGPFKEAIDTSLSLHRRS